MGSASMNSTNFKSKLGGEDIIVSVLNLYIIL
jgi:hypothetical protein